MKKIYTYEIYYNLHEKEEFLIRLKLQKTKKIFFLLDKKYKVKYISEQVQYCRDNIGIHIYSQEYIEQLEIKYELESSFNGKKEILKMYDERWLLLPPQTWKIMSFEFFSKTPLYYVSIGNIERNEQDNSYEIMGAVLVVKNDCKDVYFNIQGNNLTNYHDYFSTEKFNMKMEIEAFLSFYETCFKKKVDAKIMMVENLPAICVSFKNLILFTKEIFYLKSANVYMYFLHEIVHQMLGNTIHFVDDGAMWLKESLTEYVVLFYLKKRYGENFYYKRIKFYFQRYLKYKEHEIPISEVTGYCDDETYMATIASKGVLLFFYLFELNEINKFEDILYEISSGNRIKKLSDFWQICKKYNYDYEEVKNSINNCGVLEEVIGDKQYGNGTFSFN